MKFSKSQQMAFTQSPSTTTTAIKNNTKMENLCNKCPPQTEQLAPHCYLPIMEATIIATITTTTTTTIETKQRGKTCAISAHRRLNSWSSIATCGHPKRGKSRSRVVDLIISGWI